MIVTIKHITENEVAVPHAFSTDGTDMGPVNEGVKVTEGEVVKIYFDCKAEEKCGYPFCNGWCPGNKEQFRILDREERIYK